MTEAEKIISELKDAIEILVGIQIESISKVSYGAFTRHYVMQFTKTYLENTRLLIKLFESKDFTKEEVISESRCILRRNFDIVAKSLFVSSKKSKKERELFIVHQLLFEINTFVSRTGAVDPAWEEGDKTYKRLAKEIAGEDIQYPEILGVDRNYMKKYGYEYPQTYKMMFEKYVPEYTSSHKLTSLTGKEVYTQYALLSDYLHSGNLSNISITSRSLTAAMLEFLIPTRMYLEIVDTNYFNRVNEESIMSWIKGVIGSHNLHINQKPQFFEG